MTNITREKRRGMICAIISAIAFGCMPIFATNAHKSGADTIMVVFARHALTTLFILSILLIRKIDFKVDRKMMYRLIFCGVVGNTGIAITLFLSYQYISIGLATILHFIYPVVVTVLSFTVFKEKLGVKKIVALILSIIGVYILIGFTAIKLDILGVLLALASGVLYSIYIVQVGHTKLVELDSFVLVFYVSAISAVSTFIYGSMTNELHFTLNYDFIFNIIGVVLVSMVGLVTIAYAIKVIGPTNASIMSTLEPITSIILGVLVFTEPLTLNIVLGSLFILLSVYFVVKEEKEEQEKLIKTSYQL